MALLSLSFSIRRMNLLAPTIQTSWRNSGTSVEQLRLFSLTPVVLKKPKRQPMYRNWTNQSEYELSRISRGLSRTGYEYGPLTDKLDWSFADGRAGYPSSGQIRRKHDQIDISSTIIANMDDLNQVRSATPQIINELSSNKVPNIPDPQPIKMKIRRFPTKLPNQIGGLETLGYIAAPIRRIRHARRKRKHVKSPPEVLDSTH